LIATHFQQKSFKNQSAAGSEVFTASIVAVAYLENTTFMQESLSVYFYTMMYFA